MSANEQFVALKQKISSIESNMCLSSEFHTEINRINGAMIDMDNLAHEAVAGANATASFIERYEPVYIQR
jgi:hypothetical protein